MAFFLILVSFISTPIGLLLSLAALVVQRGGWRLSIPVAFNFALPAFFYLPNVFNDLSKYFLILDSIRNYSSVFAYFQSLDGANRLLVSQQVYFFSIAKMEVNHMLPFVSTLIVYSVLLYIISDFLTRKKASTKVRLVITVLALLMIPFGFVITNVRNVVAIALFSLAIYRDTMSNGNRVVTLVLYAVSATFHTSMLALILVRIAILPLKSFKKDRDFLRLILWLFVITASLGLLMRTTFYSEFYQKGMFYLQGGSEGTAVQVWFEQASSSRVLVVGKIVERIFCAVEIVVSSVAAVRTKQLYSHGENELLVFALIIMFITFVLTFMPGTTWIRFSIVVVFTLVFLLQRQIESTIKTTIWTFANQIGWMLMLLWLVIWQIYEFTGSADMGSKDYFSMLFPLWRIIL